MQPHAFHVPRWLRSPHLQTLGAAFPWFSPPASHARVATEDLRIPLGVGDHTLHATAWWVSEGVVVVRRPLVVLVHGIGGSSASRYVIRAAVALHRRGYHVVRLDLRGAGASVPDVPSLYHAGLSADLGVVISHLAVDARVEGVVLLGFSGGGSMALKLAGELGASEALASTPPAAKAIHGLRAVISVSAPLDYPEVSVWMDSIARLPYRFHVLRGLSTAAKEFARIHPSRAHYRPADVKRMSSFRTYDSTIIVPMHGFPDVDAYYASASPGPWLKSIRLPTLVLHADDDPMVPAGTVRPWLKSATASVGFESTPHGGHLGWVDGLNEAAWITGWSMQRALAFIEETLTPDSNGAFRT